MYLKALEIQGFKSFPQKIRLVFDKPITGIVGPNGSGKSNISDAIRWVMGEQSTKTLRGGKMEDVIFGGTERRSSLGFAEVSLVLDNSGVLFDKDTPEVMVTRRYYRSGESEYYINKQSVRLKDVNELFMDTGLGRDGYSIIGQGRIDEILSVKSEERRVVFEEAAGISRYRHRKEESERKLQRAEENLLRIADKIAELELQVEPLRGQAETAKKYLLLRDELRGLEISLWAERFTKLAVQTEMTEAERSAAAEHLIRATAELETLYDSCEKLAAKTHEQDVEAERVRGGIAGCEGKTSELESEAAVLRANLKSNLDNIERIGKEIKAQVGRNESVQAQIDERRKRITDIISERAAYAKKAAALLESSEKLAGSAGSAAEELAGLIREENRNLERVSEARAHISSLAEQMQELEDRSVSLLTEERAAAEHFEKIKASKTECAETLKKAEEDVRTVRNVISGYELRLESRRKKADALAEKKTTLSMELGSLRSRISMLDEMEKEYEGYSRAVKTVMQEASRGNLRNIIGSVAGLLKTDEQYALAVETALGPAMQYIVVDTEEDGKSAINLLKRRDAGRATFLPVSAVRGRTIEEKGLEKEEGFVGLAVDLVHADKKYSGIYSSLLGKTVVVEDIDCAIRISRRYGQRFRLVTIDGQVINAGGSMTGGSVSKSTGIISRANELKRLKENETVLSIDLKAAEKASAEAKREFDAAEYELRVAADELRPLEDTVLRLTADLDHYAVLIDAAESSLEETRLESREVSEKLSRAEAGLTASRQIASSCLEEDARLKSQISEKSEGSRSLEEERESIRSRISDARASAASLDAELGVLEQAALELESLIADLSVGKEQQHTVLMGMELQNSDIEAKIREREREIACAAAEAEMLRERLKEISDEKLKAEADRLKSDRETQSKNKLLIDLEREAARLEQKTLALEMEEKQLVDKLWDTYELTRTEAIAQRQALESISAAQIRAGELKREISKLGMPNLGAIEEFERVNSRYTYLTTQRNDIEKAKTELKDIIGDIKSEMASIFNREFGLINDSFTTTFTDLFGGGRASLELEDPDDILNCGIDIKVQPPGKTLKTITLLSGGEKAFVAIALYFAILKIRPTPFVIMDEIEAALDDANVVRFADYLRRMSDRTQFLVITHHRRTMEEADVLYGVTMQEQGISQVLCVDLDEAEKSLAK